MRVDPHGRPTVFTLLPPDEADWVTETGADVEGPPVPGRRVPGRRYSRGFDCGTGRSLPRRRCLSSPGWPTPWQGPAREGIPAWGLSSPATLGFTSEGSPKLLDFGLAHAVDDAAMVGGTLHYLSPEVLAGRPAEVQRRIRRQRLAADGPAAAAAPPSAAAVAAFAASILTAPRAGRPGTAPAFAAALAEVPGTAEQNYLQPACSVLSCHTSLLNWGSHTWVFARSGTDVDVRAPAARWPISTLQPASSTRHAMPGRSSKGVRKRSTFGTRRARPLTIPAQEGRCYPTPPRSGRRSGRSGV